MIGLTALVVGVLFAVAAYLLLSRDPQRAAMGFIVLGNAANLLVLVASGMPADAAPPLLGEAPAESVADPLPQAFILTAIVIGLGNAAFLLALLARMRGAAGPDDPEDPEWD